MLSRLHQYSIIDTLEKNPSNYSLFLYSLIDSLQSVSTDSFILVLSEIQRLEPSTKLTIQSVFSFIALANKLGLNYDLRSFYQFASCSPFTARFIPESWMDYMREKVTKSTIPLFREICELVSLPVNTVSKCFVWSQLVYPFKEDFDWSEHVSGCIDEFTQLEQCDLIELIEYCFFHEECASFYEPRFLATRQQFTNQVVGILNSIAKKETVLNEVFSLLQTMQSFQEVTSVTGCSFFEENVKLDLNELIEKAYCEGIQWSVIETAVETVSREVKVNKRDLLITFCIHNLSIFEPSRIIHFSGLFSSFLTTWSQDDLNSLFTALEHLIEEMPFSETKLLIVKLLSYYCSSFEIPRLRLLFAKTILQQILPEEKDSFLSATTTAEIIQFVIQRINPSWPVDQITELLMECSTSSYPQHFIVSLKTEDLLELIKYPQSCLSSLYHAFFYDSITFMNVCHLIIFFSIDTNLKWKSFQILAESGS